MKVFIEIWISQILIALAIYFAFYIGARLSRRAVLRLGQALEPQISQLLARSAFILLNLIGLITALGTLGIDISALVAGLGLTGFALGFALKDIISNLLAGLLILFYRPFKIGDTIKMGAYQGEVKRIDLRYTELESKGERILIPNMKLFKETITILNHA